MSQLSVRPLFDSLEGGGAGMGRFCVINLGCKVNRLESDTIAASLIAAGYERVGAEEADVIIVNTCTVTAEADAKTRKAVRRAYRDGSCPVVVTGCAAAIDPEGLTAIDPRVTVEPIHRKALALALATLNAQDEGTGHLLPETSDLSSCLVEIRAGEGFKTRMDIKIQDGCDNRCTYCIVNRARGKAASVPARQVIESVAAATAAGVNEVILAGINLGGYSSDGLLLPGLIDAILTETSIGRVRVSSIEPPHVDEALADALARHPGRLCAHFHVPLQSGCDRTLREMGRLYTTGEFAERIGLLRAVRPDVAITTDVIAGFPGETDDGFEESLAFCRELAFSRMHVFRYSRRPGTPAAERDDQVPAEVSACRAERLRTLAAEMAADDLRCRTGTVERVLVMTPDRGMTESYHEIALDSSLALAPGTLIDLPLSLDHTGTLIAG